MSNLVIAIFFTLGSTVWLFNKFSKRSGGGNPMPALIGSCVVGLIIFVVTLTLLSMIKNS